MKKSIFLMNVILAMAFTFVSCTSEDTTAGNSNTTDATSYVNGNAIKANITVAGTQDESRAIVKTSFETGDKILIWFDHNTNWGYDTPEEPDLVIAYDGTTWNTDVDADVSGNKPKALGTLKAIYNGDLKTVACQPYSYNSTTNVITSTITDWLFLTEIQVVVKGLQYDANTTYTLSCDRLKPIEGYQVNSDEIVAKLGTQGDAVTGISNSDGVAFVFATTDSYNQAADYEFTLTGAGTRMPYTAKSATIVMGKNKVIGLTIDADKFVQYVEIGGKKWATMNLGATTVAGSRMTCYGDYYAFGETNVRYAHRYANTDGSLTFDEWYSQYATYGYSSGTYTRASGDAVKEKLGGSWRIPTKKDFVALRNACTGGTSEEYSKFDELNSRNPSGGVYWLTTNQIYLPEYNGVEGVLYVDKTDTSKRLFFPAAGRLWQKTLYGNNEEGMYWSTDYKEYSDRTLGYCLRFYYNGTDHYENPTNEWEMYHGLTLRPVSD